MSHWAWDEFAEIAGGSWAIEPTGPALDFVGVSIDTRSLQPGQVFFAFVGEQCDGHAFLPAAQKHRAAACVVTHPDRVPEGFTLPTLVVKDPQDALTRLASAWRDRIRAKVIVITGSNGKTTTCRLMHGVCSAAGTSFVSPKSFNNALGVPITLLNTPIDADTLVAEVGMSTPGEIGARTGLLRPDISIITSIGRAHLQALGSVDQIAREKAQIIVAAPSEAVGVIPSGIELLDAALAEDGHLVRRVPMELDLLTNDARGNRFSIQGQVFEVPIPGAHNAYNAALCVLAGRVLGYDDETIRTGLARATPPAMRFERVQIETAGDPIVIINDAYNANPDSMRAALATFVSFDAPARRVVVLGEMLEMGDSGPAEHQSLAEHAAGLPTLDRLVLLGAGFASVRCDDDRVEIIPDSSDAGIASVAKSLKSGDTVLIKGSRGVRMERLIDKLSQLHANGRSETKNETRSHA
ncbi:MAG: hypothetical protein CMJ35_15330 [Phycisphaerae bacterium]|nr:hypothetical protein [Phycisphaerae bacterium]MBM92960.1 hypothetical protein [Phycisphaerae bacterium]